MIDEWQADKALEADPFLLSVYDFRINQAQFIINWLADYKEKLLPGGDNYSS